MFLAEIEKSTVTFIWDLKRPQIAKSISKKKNKVGGLTLPDFFLHFFLDLFIYLGLPWWLRSACNGGDLGSTPGSGRFPGEGNGYLLQYYSRLENLMHKGASQAGPWGRKELDTAKWITHTHTHTHICLSGHSRSSLWREGSLTFIADEKSSDVACGI